MPTAAAESTVAERLSYIDRVKAEARQFANKIEHKNPKYRRTRSVAVLMVQEATGAPYSEEQLRKSGCPYIRVRRTPLYSDAHLQNLVKSILDDALKYGNDASTAA
jgi:hypothetical protein